MSLTARRWNSLLKRNRVASFLPVKAEASDRMLLCELAGDHDLGCIWVAPAFVGVDHATAERLNSALSSPFPPGSFVQIETISIPDVSDVLSSYYKRKEDAVISAQARGESTHIQEIMLEQARNRAEMFESGRYKSLVPSSGVITTRYWVVITAKIPIARKKPTDTELTSCAELFARFEQAMTTVGFTGIQRLDGAQYIALMEQYFQPYTPWQPSRSEYRTINEQILDPGFKTKIDPAQGAITLNETTHVRVLSVKKLPSPMLLQSMIRLTGDPDGVNNQITCPFILSLTVHYPDQMSKSDKVNSKAMWLTHMSDSIIAKFSPKLPVKKKNFDILTDEMANGGVYCEMSLQITLLAPTEQMATNQASALVTNFSAAGFEFRQETGIAWPMFLNVLPLGASRVSIANTWRFDTMSIRQASQFAPIFGDQTGVRDAPAVILQTRHGEIMGVDLYKSPSNYNAALFAESGCGKTTFIQQLIQDYLAIGAKVWVLDSGRGYLKLCEYVGGQFISFGEDSKICLNPFTNVVDIDEDMPVIKSLLAAMAAPQDGLDDYRMARLEEAIKAVWGNQGPNSDVTTVADYLASQDDQRTRDLATMLFQYTERGSFGRWFNGRANLDLNSNFIVLETDDLKNKGNLQKVVQLALMARVQYEMYTAKMQGFSKPKIFIADEAREYLPDRSFRFFLSSSYSRFRKYEGSAIIILQSIASLLQYPDLESVMANCRFKFIFQQTGESVNLIQEKKLLDVDSYAFHLMKGVHTSPDQYAEVMVVDGNSGYGIARHIMDPFSKILTSSRGAARYRVFDLMQQGVPVREAVATVMAEAA